MKLAAIDRLLARRRAVACLLGVLAGLFAFYLGATAVDDMLREARDRIRTRPASGEIHIVEIDSRSIRELAQWPWPRRFHAQLIDRLGAAGVRSIGFDVDFSSPSNPVDDAAMAAALARAHGAVVLATLTQQSGSGRREMVDNVPIPALRENAFLASVNMLPDGDGQVRQMLLGIETDGAPRPALAAMVAERDARAEGSFPIDYSIDPASIPRHSFVDVVRGRVAPSVLAGRRILIGATAVELGDRYAVPGHGVIPGVVIQALAAETLLAGPPPRIASPIWALLLAVLLILATVRRGPRLVRGPAYAAGTAAILLLPLASEQWFALTLPLAPALAAIVVASLASLALHAADRFRRRSFIDHATGLPNLDALAAGAEAGSRVVAARIDHMATIAAGIGPDATARLIHRIVDRLQFGRAAVIYRIDESNLAWIESGDGDREALQDRIAALVAVMRAPVDCGRLIDVQLNFGIAEPVAEGAKQQAANAALAAERAARRAAPLEWFGAADQQIDWHLSLLGELDSAISRGEVWNAYQPKLDLASGRIVGVEALIRWDHPQRGKIAPDEFIPHVEASGRSRDLTLAVLRQAIEDVRTWRSGGLDIGVAVNVSATLLLDAAFVVELEREIRASGVPAEALTLEVTESAAMGDAERAIAALHSWRALGLGISIDDYGTGQSALNYLQRLPATELKIDKSFVTTIASDPRNAIMVRSTIAMAHELGMKVVAEGIEDAQCLSRLREMGCDTGQGWHIGRPMTARAFADFLADDGRKPERQAA